MKAFYEKRKKMEELELLKARLSEVLGEDGLKNASGELESIIEKYNLSASPGKTSDLFKFVQMTIFS